MLIAKSAWLGPAFAACACVPAVTPPSQLSISDGTSTGRAGPEQEKVLRGTLHPQQLFASQESRIIDFGAGYRVDVQRDGHTVHGPISELGILPLRWQKVHARFGVRNIGEVLIDDQDPSEPGWSYTLAASAEIAGFYTGSEAETRNGEFVAYAIHGEAGLGLFAGLTHRSLGGEDSNFLIAGISGRLPASAWFYVCGKCAAESLRR